MLQKSNLDMRQMHLGLRKSQIGSSPSPSGQHECQLNFGMTCKISGCVKLCRFGPLRPPQHFQAISSRRSLNSLDLTYQAEPGMDNITPASSMLYTFSARIAGSCNT